MTLNPVSITNYRECNGVVRVANGVALPIEGVGDILMSSQSDFGETDLQLLNVAFVPLLSHNLLPLKQFTRRADHSYRGDGDGATLFCKSGRWFFAPTVKGRMEPIAKTTKSRADKRGGRVFLDVCGPKTVRSDQYGEKSTCFWSKMIFLGFLLCAS